MKQKAVLPTRRCLIDLHLHLDGSLSLSTVRRLARNAGVALPDDDAVLLQRLSVAPDCRNLNEYLEKFAFPLTLLQTADALTIAVSRLIEELYEQGLIYAEIRFAPQLHCAKGLTQTEVVEAAVKGLQNAKLPCGLILCCMRGADNNAENLETVRTAAAFLGRGVVAVDLAGAEALFSTAAFEREFALAHELGIPFTIHAGEADGPESVKKALEMGASRIGHGVRAVEDPELLIHLAKTGILLECCPTSNLQTQVFSSVFEYPVRQFLQAGVKFSVNTDNITVSSTALHREWALLIDSFALTTAEIKEILLDTANAAFATDEVKQALREQINKAFAI